MSLSVLPSLDTHCQAKAAPASPSASSMPSADALSVSPTRAVPAMSGSPVGAAFTASFVTAWLENPATALPAASLSGIAPAPAGAV